MIQPRFLEPAESELEDAVTYFDQQLSGLGDRFQREIEHTIALIVQYPEAGSALTKRVRKFRVRKFRYSIIYVPDDHEVLIVAVAHHRKRPGYWRNRLHTFS